MIDYEIKIFNVVYPKIAPLCAQNRFVSTQIATPAALPCASLFEMDNRTVRSLQSSTPTENYAKVTYQLDVYAKGKAECRKVYAAADSALIALNFTRVSGQYINSADNAEVVRYAARYEAVIDPDGQIYRA